MQRPFILALLLITLVALLALPVAAQEDTVQMRVGFFAFDPDDYDLYIDGQLSPVWGSGFANHEWMNGPVPSPWDYINCCSASPYLPIAAGDHRFAITPAGQDLNSAVFGPKDIALEADHIYSLAVVGAIEDGSLNILPIDETVEFTHPNPLSRLQVILVNNIPGLPSVYLGSGLDATVDYADYLAVSKPGGSAVIYDAYTDESETTPVVRVDFPFVPAQITEFHVLLGPLPGSEDTRNRFSFGHGYSGDVTLRDAGPITVGQSLEGALEHLRERNRYTLELGQPAVLNILAQANGPTTRSTWGYAPAVDTALYLYDSEGHLIFWNDEASSADDWTETPSSDAAITALPLEAGTYFIEVGAFTDQIAGPYRLTVEAVRPAA